MFFAKRSFVVTVYIAFTIAVLTGCIFGQATGAILGTFAFAAAGWIFASFCGHMANLTKKDADTVNQLFFLSSVPMAISAFVWALTSPVISSLGQALAVLVLTLAFQCAAQVVILGHGQSQLELQRQLSR